MKSLIKPSILEIKVIAETILLDLINDLDMTYLKLSTHLLGHA